MSLFYHFSSDEMIDSTSTLVRTESVKSQQSSVTMASNDSVSEHRFVSQLSPDDIAVIIIIIIIIISPSSLSSSSSSIYLRECIRPSVSITTFYRTGSLALSLESSPTCGSRGSYFIFLYSLTTFAWLALTGVQDSRRHSCRGHADVQTASTL